MMRQWLVVSLVLIASCAGLSAQTADSAPPRNPLACPAETGPPSQAPHKWIVVSAGMMTRNRIGGKDPKYPPDARKAHIEGTVVLEATISASGSVEDLCVSQGPELLQQASIDAVKKWKYRPFLLNGEPREVKTQINCVFTLQ
jgi:TonB family protein